MLLRESAVVGSYVLLRKLGEGRFGQVWQARHTRLPIERALKIPTDFTYIRQLRQEASIQINLDHPGIVRAYDLVLHTEPPYIVMEYVRGEDLRKRLRGQGRLGLGLEESLRFTLQILDAVRAAHGQHVLHRDLKPENVLIGIDGRVKVTDFGLGNLPAQRRSSIILSGSVLQAGITGTYDYMSPEQKEGADADERDDIYAVGVILCEMLTGSRPTGAGVRRMLQRGGIEGKLVDVLEKSLEERPFRYFTAGEMHAGLVDAIGRVRAFAAGATTTNVDVSVPAPHEPTRSIAGPVAKVALATPVMAAALAAAPAPSSRAIVPQSGGPDVTLVGMPSNLIDVRDDKPIASWPAPWVHVKSDQVIRNSIGIEMVKIAPGEFVMGLDTDPPPELAPLVTFDPNAEPISYDATPHRSRLSRTFYIGVVPVTQEQWNALMWRNPSMFRGGDLPVDGVTWHDAAKFCHRLSRKEARTYRLPTEAEWEYACRAGTITAFNIGDATHPMHCAWHSENSGGRTRPVGQKHPNAWGLYDMHGNVWEWCRDQFGDYPPGEVADYCSESAADDRPRVLRGGAFSRCVWECRSAVRFWLAPRLSGESIGFRVVMEV
jgi:eukaryotic-like serine/threonine-protein kinase